jgi:hypothetical protein
MRDTALSLFDSYLKNRIQQDTAGTQDLNGSLSTSLERYFLALYKEVI